LLLFHNGGLTWTAQTLTSTYGVYGEPHSDGKIQWLFLLFFIYQNPTSGNWIDRMVCQKSTNAGLTWSNGSYAGLNYPIKEQDKEGVVIDRRRITGFLYLYELDTI